MVDSNETQALMVVSNQVLESQLKIIWNNQCNKAQDFLVAKIKRELERLQELCSSIYKANSILDLEINAAQEVIKSLFAAEMSLKAANVELRKDLIIKKEQFCSIYCDNRTKCEMLWNESKDRYESLPFIKTFLDSNKRAQNVRNELNELQNKVEKLNKAIIIKKNDIATTDKKRIIELANFMQRELPSKLKLIEEKKHQISDLTKEKQRLNNKANVWGTYVFKTNNCSSNSNSKLFMGKDFTDNLFLTRPFRMDYPDLETMHLKLNQIKKSKSTITITEIDDEDKTNTVYNNNKIEQSDTKKTEDYMSVYFKKPTYPAPVETNSSRFTKRKLIDILEDVKIDKSDAFALISKANPQKLLCVDSIAIDRNRSKPVITEEIEEIDMCRDENVLMPPTQFKDVIGRVINNGEALKENLESEILDLHATLPQSQEKKKSVSFDVTSVEINEGEKSIDNKEASFDTIVEKEIIEADETKNSNFYIADKIIEDNANETINSGMDDANVSDNSNRLKEIMLRQEKLNLSPQFVYSRNTNIMEDRSLVTSKFFKRDESSSFIVDMFKNKKENEAPADDNNVKNVFDRPSDILNENTNETVASMGVNNVPKKPEVPTKVNKPITGLFQHTSQGLPSSLNTTGLDEGDADYPHCIDSSLLLSPKADIPSDNPVDESKEVSNFLCGLKRSVFPFFGQAQATEDKPDTNTQNQEDQFSFTFTSQEKKTRNTLFNIFK